ncbi:MAG TPA: hypothetical protein VMF29_03550 [Candidatus Edwardsbacteria bacterium]|nr:hypothetical protein [Candidatus Edwardsbacteria bacterium]
MIDLEEKRRLLLALAAQLEVLIGMLELEPDPRRRYDVHFRPLLERARQLAQRDFTFDELKQLSSALEGVMNRPFQDYSPGAFDAEGRFQAAPGTEHYQETADRVAALALELRVIGTY